MGRAPRAAWEGAARFSTGRAAKGSPFKPAARGMLETAPARREGSRGRGRRTRPLADGEGWAAPPPRPTAARGGYGICDMKKPRLRGARR